MSIRNRLALAMAMLVLGGACAAAPTRNYTLRGPSSFYGDAQAKSAGEWMQKRGIYDHVSYGRETVSFKFGSDEIRTMNYDAFDTFVTSRIAGQTIASAQRANYLSSEGSVPGSIVYFDPAGRFAQWSGALLINGTWWLEDVPEVEQEKARRLGVEPPRRVLCFQREATRGGVLAPAGLPHCMPAYEQLIGIHGKRAGDVFNLLSGQPRGLLSPENPKTWPDGGALFPERAPHE